MQQKTLQVLRKRTNLSQNLVTKSPMQLSHCFTRGRLSAIQDIGQKISRGQEKRDQVILNPDLA